MTLRKKLVEVKRQEIRAATDEKSLWEILVEVKEQEKRSRYLERKLK